MEKLPNGEKNKSNYLKNFASDEEFVEFRNNDQEPVGPRFEYLLSFKLKSKGYTE